MESQYNRLNRWDTLVLLLLGVLMVVNLWQLHRIPTNVTGDEVTFLNDLLHIAYSPNAATPLTLMGDGTKAGIGLYYVALVARMFPEDQAVLGMRLASVIMGIVTLGVFYGYLRQKVARGPALFAILLLGTNYVYLNLSRATWMAHGTGIGLIFGILSFLLLELGVSRRRWWLSALGGASAGLVLYSYLGTIFLPVVSLLYLAYLVSKRRLDLPAASVHGAAFCVAAFLIFLPNLWSISQNHDVFATRPRVVYVATTEDEGYQGLDTANVVWRQVSGTVGGFLLLDGAVTGAGPENARYSPAGEPPVDDLTKLLFFLALPVALLFHRKDLFQPLGAFVLMLLLTQLATVYPPNYARGVLALPFIYLLVAVLLDAIWARPLGWGMQRQRLLQFGLAAMVLVTALWNVQHYFEWGRSPALAQAREPAIEFWQVRLWIDEEKRRIASGESDLAITTDDWQQLVRAAETDTGQSEPAVTRRHAQEADTWVE